MKYFWAVVLILTLAGFAALSVDANRHEWHPIGPNVKFGTLIEEEKENDGSLRGTDLHGEPKSYVKKSFTWNSNEITEDSVQFVWSDATVSTSVLSITATTFDFGPDANAWVRFDWCSRHGDVRAVRVE